MDEFKTSRTFEMLRMQKILCSMTNIATTNELIRVNKLCNKLIENENWSRWGKGNEAFLSDMESKYC